MAIVATRVLFFCEAPLIFAKRDRRLQFNVFGRHLSHSALIYFTRIIDALIANCEENNKNDYYFPGTISVLILIQILSNRSGFFLDITFYRNCLLKIHLMCEDPSKNNEIVYFIFATFFRYTYIFVQYLHNPVLSAYIVTLIIV